MLLSSLQVAFQEVSFDNQSKNSWAKMVYPNAAQSLEIRLEGTDLDFLVTGTAPGLCEEHTFTWNPIPSLSSGLHGYAVFIWQKYRLHLG